MGKVRYGQHGYVGSSMSVRAVEAYANGEMPKSKWTKAAMLYAIDNQLNEFEDDQKITSEEREELFTAINAMKKEEMFSTFMEFSSWHHTGKFANATDFYSASEDLDNYQRFAMEKMPESEFGKHLIDIERKAQEEQEWREAERHVNQEKFEYLLAQGEKDFSDKIFENVTLEGLTLENINFDKARFDKNCTVNDFTIRDSQFRGVVIDGGIINMKMHRCDGDLRGDFIEGLEISNSIIGIGLSDYAKNPFIRNLTVKECKIFRLDSYGQTHPTPILNLTVDNVTHFYPEVELADFTNVRITNSSIAPFRLRDANIRDSHVENCDLRLDWDGFKSVDFSGFSLENTELSNMTINSLYNTPEALGFNRINFTNSSFTGVLEADRNETSALPYSVDTRQLEPKENLSINQPLGKEGIRNLIAEQTQQKIQLGETQTPLTQQQKQQHLNR